MYSALNEDNTIAIAQQFKEDTGIEIEYISLGGGDAVARVQAEMGNPQADFLVGGSVDLYGSLAEAGAFVEYDSPNNDDLDERFQRPQPPVAGLVHGRSEHHHQRGAVPGGTGLPGPGRAHHLGRPAGPCL